MPNNYAGAVRSGAMAAARLHRQLGSERKAQDYGGCIDVFGAMLSINLPMLLRPLRGLLGAYLPMPTPGVLVTTERPLSIQRFTAAHELGHFRLNHRPSLDNENILRRAFSPIPTPDDEDFQETEADAFAVGFLMPRWLIHWHCQRQSWIDRDLSDPHNVYQLSLRLGASYEATTWTLQRYNFVTSSIANTLRQIQPRQIKIDLLQDYTPENYRGDVWLLTERDAGTLIEGSRNDCFVLRLTEHSGSGYLWNIEQLKSSGFVIVRDGQESEDNEGIGGFTIRHITAALEEAQRGQVSLDESRPWQPTSPLTKVTFNYDFTGPEEEGLSRAERRHLLEAA